MQVDIYFSKMTPEFIAKARAATAEHQQKLEAFRLESAMAAQQAAIDEGKNPEEALAAGKAAAASIKRLPDDPLDKVARHEENAKAHPDEKSVATNALVKKNMAKAKKARLLAASAAATETLEADRVPRPPKPTVDILKKLLKAKGLPVRGTKHELEERLATYEAMERELGDDATAAHGVPGPSDVTTTDEPTHASGVTGPAEVAATDEPEASGTDNAYVTGKRRRSESVDHLSQDPPDDVVISSQIQQPEEDSNDDEISDDDLPDACDADRDEGAYFKEEKNPQYLVYKLNDLYAQKLESKNANKLKEAIRTSISDIVSLCYAHAPPLKLRAQRWKSMLASFERAMSTGTDSPIHLGKLIPFILTRS